LKGPVQLVYNSSVEDINIKVCRTMMVALLTMHGKPAEHCHSVCEDEIFSGKLLGEKFLTKENSVVTFQ
jgi:hypothetical protein